MYTCVRGEVSGRVYVCEGYRLCFCFYDINITFLSCHDSGVLFL